MHTLRVSDLMSTDLIVLEQNETLDLAQEIMHLARIRHLPVTLEGRLIGLVTHRDLLKAQVSMLAGISRDESWEINSAIPAESIMTNNVRTIDPDSLAMEAAKLMRDQKIGCLPVIDDGLLVGIVTEADFLNLVIKALQQGEEEQPGKGIVAGKK